MLIRLRPAAEINSSLSHLPPVLARIFAARGIHHPDELDQRLSKLLPFTALLGIDQAVQRLYQALKAQQRILVIGDFDADGATSTALAVSTLRAFGAMHVDFLVPNRFEFGYGLTPGIVALAQAKAPDLIITVDNGISSFEGVDAANDAGIDVLVTDHHLPAEQLPKACAIVNPNQAGDSFFSKSIAGVGVIFYVLLALRHYLREQQWFTTQGVVEPNMGDCLDLVALGTVADVVALDHNNRILVSQGLQRIRQGKCRPGLLALLEIAGKQCATLREIDLGFAVAPRLNAAGRLDDMSLGIQCLLAKSTMDAMPLASELDALNQERKQIEADMSAQAFTALNALQLDTTPVALCLMDESWHQGVIGILAGRLKDRYHRPTVVFALSHENEIKGSARSVPSINIRDVLAAIDRDHPGLITKFGGHAMAAGLSLAREGFAAFKQALIAEVGQQLDVELCRGEILSDGELTPQDLTLEFAEQLHAAGPWGQHFPEPIFDNCFTIVDQRLVGQKHIKFSLQHTLGGEIVDAIAFNIDTAEWPNHRARQLHAAYKLDINHYRGRSRLQLMLQAIQAVAPVQPTSAINYAEAD
jgi:single-stranded-DNA-specific exonuclease